MTYDRNINNLKNEEFVSNPQWNENQILLLPIQLDQYVWLSFGEDYYNTTAYKSMLCFKNIWGNISAVINEYSWNVDAKLWLKTIRWEYLAFYFFNWWKINSINFEFISKRLTQRILFKVHHSEAVSWLPLSEDGLKILPRKAAWIKMSFQHTQFLWVYKLRLSLHLDSFTDPITSTQHIKLKVSCLASINQHIPLSKDLASRCGSFIIPRWGILVQ